MGRPTTKKPIDQNDLVGVKPIYVGGPPNQEFTVGNQPPTNPNLFERIIKQQNIQPNIPQLDAEIPPDMEDDDIEFKEPIRVSKEIDLDELYELRAQCNVSKNVWMHKALGDRIQQIRDELYEAYHESQMIGMGFLTIAIYDSTKKKIPAATSEFFKKYLDLLKNRGDD